jgi:hypothetical protein
MSTHTPEPWIHCEEFAGRVIAADGTPIADVFGEAARAQECDDNQSLIAAAPELLAVLLDLRAAILDGRPDDARGIAAGDVLADTIAKATGAA